MSDPSPAVPGWIAGSLIGLMLGAGGTLLYVRAIEKASQVPGETVAAGETVSSAPSAPGGPPGMGPPGGMGGMMGMMGGMGGPRPKRTLTTLVGKVELLTRKPLHVQLSPEQSAKFADLLSKVNAAETMTNDEAQSHVDALDALWTPEQKEVLDSISLPFGRPGGGGPGGPGGGPGGGPPGMGSGGEDENPFTQETNQKRLKDLLERLGGGAPPLPPGDAAKPAEPAAEKPTAEVKPEADTPAAPTAEKPAESTPKP